MSLAATQGLEEWLPLRGWSEGTPPARQNPAYRPPGNQCVCDVRLVPSLTNVSRTVVELSDLVRRAKAILTDAERGASMLALAADPDTGVALSGGLRKVRFAREGGARAVTFERLACAVAESLRPSRTPHSPGTKTTITRDAANLPSKRFRQTPARRPAPRWEQKIFW